MHLEKLKNYHLKIVLELYEKSYTDLSSGTGITTGIPLLLVWDISECRSASATCKPLTSKV